MQRLILMILSILLAVLIFLLAQKDSPSSGASGGDEVKVYTQPVRSSSSD